ncbi:RusA family crossover junction endodeoxyribonuclease, partial [Clostridioides sp. ES-S-0056-01]|nr:RusA family crossover junction endodeoxyribonuclease [Clostridioides sp. ES-S-0056-01]MCC0716996.1 RusA family crossover junction endodeoxyribonuclease [Clostridioides sp. ES-S-0077-01]
MRVNFTIDGEPVGKGRPRMNTYAKRTYTPNKT